MTPWLRAPLPALSARWGLGPELLPVEEDPTGAVDPCSHQAPLPAHRALGTLERAPHRHPAPRELEWPQAPAPLPAEGSLAASALARSHRR